MKQNNKIKYSLILTLLTLLLLPFTSALEGDLLAEFPNNGITQDWRTYTSSTETGNPFLQYTNNNTGEITIDPNITGAGYVMINVSSADWRGLILNMTFILEDTGQVFGSGDNIAISLGNGTRDIHNPDNKGADFTINSCNLGELSYMANIVDTCALHQATRSVGNHTFTMIWDTTKNTSNVEFYIDGVKNPVNGTVSREVPQTKLSSVLIGRVGSYDPMRIFNLTVREAYSLTTPQDSNILFSDYANETLNLKWQGNTSDFAYSEGWLNFTGGGTRFLKNLTQELTTGIYTFNFTSFDDSSAITASTAISFGLSNSSVLNSPNLEGAREYGIEFGSGTCNLYQNQYHVSNRSFGDCPGGTGINRTSGAVDWMFYIDLDADEVQYYRNGVNTHNGTLPTNYAIRSIYFYSTNQDAYKFTNITLCEGYCNGTNEVTPPAPENLSNITVIKNVINDDNGTLQVSDFTLYINGLPTTNGTTVNLFPNTYMITETNNANYTATYSGDCDATGNITLLEGESLTCIITNNDNAVLNPFDEEYNSTFNTIISILLILVLVSFVFAKLGAGFMNSDELNKLYKIIGIATIVIIIGLLFVL